MSATVFSAQDKEFPTEPDEAAKANTAGVVPAERVRVWEDDFHRLHVSVDGKEFADVRAVRAFPISGKADYVSFLDKDDKEVALLAHPHVLDEDSGRALHEALQKMYYVAKITRVYSIMEKMGVTHWQVMSDRGYASFEVADHENIRRLPRGRFLIADADGNRFEIEDVTELDLRSQALVRSQA